MPSWSDENGRYWFQGAEIPHPPVQSKAGCACVFCRSLDRQKPASVAPKVPASLDARLSGALDRGNRHTLRVLQWLLDNPRKSRLSTAAHALDLTQRGLEALAGRSRELVVVRKGRKGVKHLEYRPWASTPWRPTPADVVDAVSTAPTRTATLPELVARFSTLNRSLTPDSWHSYVARALRVYLTGQELDGVEFGDGCLRYLEGDELAEYRAKQATARTAYTEWYNWLYLNGRGIVHADPLTCTVVAQVRTGLYAVTTSVADGWVTVREVAPRTRTQSGAWTTGTLAVRRFALPELARGYVRLSAHFEEDVQNSERVPLVDEEAPWLWL